MHGLEKPGNRRHFLFFTGEALTITWVSVPGLESAGSSMALRAIEAHLVGVVGSTVESESINSSATGFPPRFDRKGFEARLFVAL